MNQNEFYTIGFGRILTRVPDAAARLQGSAEYPDVTGLARFYDTPFGCLIAVEAEGLPYHEGRCEKHFFGMHIHQGFRCSSGTPGMPFEDAGAHYNPDQCLHPQHAGDLPPLLEGNGRAFSAVLAGELRVQELLGKTLIVHTDPDDFHSQPAGNAGARMACGIILPVRR